jgi:hypothetical protein
MQDLLNLMASTNDPDVLLNCCAAIVNITRNSEGVRRELDRSWGISRLLFLEYGGTGAKP